MSGIVAAQMKRNSAINRKNQERSFEVGDHKRVVDYGTDYWICMDCDKKVKNDLKGREEMRERVCE